MSDSWDKRLAPWFEKRRWRVQDEFDGTVTLGGVTFIYRRGVFDIEPPGVFISPFGTRGRHGIAVIEVDPAGKDIPGSAVAFGESVLRRANELFNTISGLSAAEDSLCALRTWTTSLSGSPMSQMRFRLTVRLSFTTWQRWPP